jgi:hypothetical protein
VISYRTVPIVTAATVTQNLPEQAAEVLSVVGLAGAATSIAATQYTVVATTPGAGQVEFTGTPEAPSATLTFNAALTAAGLLIVTYRPVGAIQADD